ASHPLIEALAGSETVLQRSVIHSAAETLFLIATLHSPLEATRLRITSRIVDSLVARLMHTLDEPGSERAEQPGPPHRFVALPYSSDLGSVYDAIREVLEAPPTLWRVFRADQNVKTLELLPNVLHNIENSRRYVADVSGANQN